MQFISVWSIHKLWKNDMLKFDRSVLVMLSHGLIIASALSQNPAFGSLFKHMISWQKIISSHVLKIQFVFYFPNTIVFMTLVFKVFRCL